MSKNFRGLEVIVLLDDEKEEYDEIDKVLFEESILGYIKIFKTLPHIGLKFDNTNHDSHKIEDMYFDGINRRLKVYLIHELR